MAKKIKTLDGAEGEVHPNGESELGISPVPAGIDDTAKEDLLTPATNGVWQDDEVVEEADQAPEPALDPFTQYVNESLQWFRKESFGQQRGYHSASAVQSRGFLLLAELLIALEHRLGQIERAANASNGLSTPDAVQRREAAKILHVDEPSNG